MRFSGRATAWIARRCERVTCGKWESFLSNPRRLNPEQRMLSGIFWVLPEPRTDVTMSQLNTRPFVVSLQMFATVRVFGGIGNSDDASRAFLV